MKPDVGADSSTLEGVRTLLSMIKRSEGRRRFVILAVSIVAVIIANAFGQIRLNLWQGAFYDALSQRNLNHFFYQLGVFVVVVGVLLVLGVAQTWLHAVLKTRMREMIAHDVLTEWLRPMRAYRIPLAGEIGTNPDQRIQDDARSLTDISTDFCVGLVHSSLLLISFVGVLWSLSEKVVFSFRGAAFTIPGYMVWCALAYALIGSWAAWRVGRPLVRLNAQMRQREADFRFSLVRVNESSEGIALYRGESDERRLINIKFGSVISTMLKLANMHARLTWVTASYGWLAIVVPIIVTAPGYFAGTLSFGGLMMVVGAFNQVQQSLRWYVDNYGNIAAWHAMSWRVITYRNVLRKMETMGGDRGFVELTEHPQGKLAIRDGFAVLAPNGRIAIDEPDFEVAPGEHVLISGKPGTGKSTFFRALAGLWPWGHGKAALPPLGDMMFLPHHPYMPLGTLRDALTYPEPGRFSDAEVRAALDRLLLSHRAVSLGRYARWDKELSLDEQQRIAYVRVLLQEPRWIIEDESMSALDSETREVVQSIFEKELAGAAVVSIGRDEFRNHFYQRLYHLSAHPPGLPLPFHWEGQPRTPEAETERSAV